MLVTERRPTSKTVASPASATTGSGRPDFSAASTRSRSPAKAAAMAALEPSAAPVAARRPSETKTATPTTARGAADEGRTRERAQARDGAEADGARSAHESALPYGRV